MDQDDELDDYDRSRASDMDDRPIYPGPALIDRETDEADEPRSAETEV